MAINNTGILPNVTGTLLQALEDIKKIIQDDPSRESVSVGTLTLVNIYAIIEEVEEKLNLQHK
jgi:hypothetical protein